MNITEAIGILSGVAKTAQEQDAVKTLKEALKIVDNVEPAVIKFNFKCVNCGERWQQSDTDKPVLCPKCTGEMLKTSEHVDSFKFVGCQYFEYGNCYHKSTVVACPLTYPVPEKCLINFQAKYYYTKR